MNYGDWYTDLLDIHRVQPYMDGSLTKNKRVETASGIRCRVYRSAVDEPRMQSTAAYSDDVNKLACDNEVDIRAGDELLIHRGAVLGKSRQTMRAFAGDPVYFYEPFGAVLPGLAHQEVGLLQKEYLKGDGRDGAG